MTNWKVCDEPVSSRMDRQDAGCQGAATGAPACVPTLRRALPHLRQADPARRSLRPRSSHCFDQRRRAPGKQSGASAANAASRENRRGRARKGDHLSQAIETRIAGESSQGPPHARKPGQRLETQDERGGGAEVSSFPCSNDNGGSQVWRQNPRRWWVTKGGTDGDIYLHACCGRKMQPGYILMKPPAPRLTTRPCSRTTLRGNLPHSRCVDRGETPKRPGTGWNSR